MTKARDQITRSETAIKRGWISSIVLPTHRTALESYGSLLICCFALVGATSRDAGLRQLVRSRARKLARRWGRAHPHVPPDAGSDLIRRSVLVSYALSRLGLRDAALNAEIRTAAKRFSAQDLLGFNPISEPPPMICLSHVTVA